jgi:hypothetical protein
MSSIRLDTLIDEFPEERDSIEKLSAFIDKKQAGEPRRTELTVQRIFDVVEPSSEGTLLSILQRLVQQGVLTKVLRVESDSTGGIGDFESLDKIPRVLWDSRVGVNVEVRLDQVKLVYILPPRDNSV